MVKICGKITYIVTFVVEALKTVDRGGRGYQEVRSPLNSPTYYFKLTYLSRLIKLLPSD